MSLARHNSFALRLLRLVALPDERNEMFYFENPVNG